MEIHSFSHTSPSRRSSSRIYQDLAACLLPTSTHPDSGRLVNMRSQATAEVPRSSKLSQVPHVCIVGAGVAELRCADMLLQSGFRVTILEARDRIGGRICQTKMRSGQVVDLGANWIHGTDDNPIFEIAKQTSTETHCFKEDPHVFGDDGQIIGEGPTLSNTMWLILKQAFKHSAENTSTIEPNESLLDFFSMKVKENFPNDDESSQRKVLLQMISTWGAFVGREVATQSLKFFWLEECIDGENLFCAGTYTRILQQLAQPAIDGTDLRLSTKVTSIKSSLEKVEIATETGSSMEFDEVVVTSPLGWLKRNKQIFEPPLPERLSVAIDSIGYGCLEKVYISFPHAFWLGDATKPDNDPFVAFTQWLAPSYAKVTNPERWAIEMVELSTLPGSCAEATLLFYLWGDQSIHVAGNLSKLASEASREEFLIQHFKPYYSRLPHYSEESARCQPTACLGTTWVTDELAGYGSYANFQTGLMEGDRDIETMREGLPDRRIWFAGEHVAPFVALGTVTGAYWAGEAVGARIAGAYDLGDGKSRVLHDAEDVVSGDGTKESSNTPPQK